MGFLIRLLLSTLSVLVRYPFLARKDAGEQGNQQAARRDYIRRVFAASPVVHRGGVPENTIEGFKLSKMKGATCVEADLQFTKDGHPILIHDDTVDRTSNGTGAVQDMTLEEIKRLDVGAKFGHPGVKIPTLNEAIEALFELDLFMFLEVKTSDHQTLLELFRNNQSLYDRIAVISFFPDVLYKISRKDPRVMTGYCICGTSISYIDYSLPRFNYLIVQMIAKLLDKIVYWIIKRLLFKAINPEILLPDKEDILFKRLDIERYRKEGAIVLTWTVNDANEQRHLSEVLRVPYMTDII